MTLTFEFYPESRWTSTPTILISRVIQFKSYCPDT